MFRLENDHNFKSCQKLLTTLRFILFRYELQLRFRHHLHCITFTCHKDSWTSNRPKVSTFLEKHQIIKSLYFECFLCVSNSPLLSQKKINIKKFVYYENQGPFYQTSNVWWNTCPILKVFHSNQNSKLKYPMGQFNFFKSILIIKYNLPWLTCH
jgi:hypothetical protein